jgi:hypothetical protein
MDERERLFFDHDIATPLSNLRGADFLLCSGLKDPDERTSEALDILSGSIHHIERMLGWYAKTHDLRGRLDAVPPWSASSLPGALASRILEEGAPLAPPEVQGKIKGWADMPLEPLAIGLIGAGVTLASASGMTPGWILSAVRGVLKAAYHVPGDRLALDPSRLFSKYYWPSPKPHWTPLDAGFPYLEAALEPFGGGLEMVWEEGVWTLLATLPLSERKGGR